MAVVLPQVADKIPGHWNTQLAITWGTDIIPIHSFEIRVNTEKRIIHSLHAHNLLILHLPHEFSFSIRLHNVKKPGLTNYSAKMLETALTDRVFQLSLGTMQDDHNWSWESIGMDECVIDNIRMSGMGPKEMPESMIACKCLKFNPSPGPVDSSTYGSGT